MFHPQLQILVFDQRITYLLIFFLFLSFSFSCCQMQAARDFLMQCFQKDPNLRVSARKLLRHAWIVGCRRAEAPVSKAPDNFNQAVEEVKQWNKALNSSESALRSSTGSEYTASSRFVGGTPSKGPFGLAKPRLGVEAFKTVELPGAPTEPLLITLCILRYLMHYWQITTTGMMTLSRPFHQVRYIFLT